MSGGSPRIGRHGEAAQPAAGSAASCFRGRGQRFPEGRSRGGGQSAVQPLPPAQEPRAERDPPDQGWPGPWGLLGPTARARALGAAYGQVSPGSGLQLTASPKNGVETSKPPQMGCKTAVTD